MNVRGIRAYMMDSVSTPTALTDVSAQNSGKDKTVRKVGQSDDLLNVFYLLSFVVFCVLNWLG